MAWQSCPVCQGCGTIGIGYSLGSVCSVCMGQKIINEETGQPPYTLTVTTGTEITLSNGVADATQGKKEGE